MLRLGSRIPDTGPIRDAAERVGMPLTETALPDPELAELYGAPLALVRPDGHVAWRGDALPEDPLEIIDRTRGAAA